MTDLKVPFPYMGSKRRVAEDVWERFGDVKHYFEPFAGSLSVLIKRPDWHQNDTQTVNDLDGFITNFWRSIKHDPKGVAGCLKDEPIIELDTHAKARWLLNEEDDLIESLRKDIDFYDTKAAAYWVYGQSCWKMSGWPSESKKMPHHAEKNGRGTFAIDGIKSYFKRIKNILSNTRIICGNWNRIVNSYTQMVHCGTPVSIFLDPPYTKTSGRGNNIYNEDSLSVGNDVYEWCIEHQDIEGFKIALCGFEDEYDIPDSWDTINWKSDGGNKNQDKERIWFSPQCKSVGQETLI